MTVAELMKALDDFHPDLEVFFRTFPKHHIVPVNYRPGVINEEGTKYASLVFIDAMEVEEL